MEGRGGGHNIVIVVLMSAATLGLLSTASVVHHKTHIVGQSYDWRNPKNATFYQEWAHTRRFAVGDKLVFLFTTMVQNVVEVPSAEDWAACLSRNVTGIHYVGPAILELTEVGPRHFFCGIGLHCEAGQKLSIDVSGTPHPDIVVLPAAPAPSPSSALLH